MKIYIPDLVVTLDGLDTPIPERLGGLPVGLEAAAWPKCAECGSSQSLIAQFLHHPERLDLGREGRQLLIFQCNHDPGMCATWDAFSGANACLVIEPENLGTEETPLPDDAPPLENRALIAGWILDQDGLSEDQARLFFSDDDFFSLHDDMLERATWSTRLGGVPRWMQSPNEAPAPNWDFIGQLDSMYSFRRNPDVTLPWISPDPELFEGRTHLGMGPNFGGGIAYLFIQRGADTPVVVMLWQR